MRTFADEALRAQTTERDGEGMWLRAPDVHGRPHVLRVDEGTYHEQSFACICRPKYKRGVIVHRKMRDSGALFQPWEGGH